MLIRKKERQLGKLQIRKKERKKERRLGKVLIRKKERKITRNNTDKKERKKERKIRDLKGLTCHKVFTKIPWAESDTNTKFSPS